jgi:hypothetical protein
VRHARLALGLPAKTDAEVQAEDDAAAEAARVAALPKGGAGAARWAAMRGGLGGGAVTQQVESR